MPTYTLKDPKTNHQFDVYCTWNELQEKLDHQPDLIHVLTAPKIVSGTGTNFKVDGGFKEVMGKMKSKYSVNNIPDY